MEMSFKENVDAILNEVGTVGHGDASGAELNIVIKKDDPEARVLKKDMRMFVNDALKAFKDKLRSEMAEWKKRTAGYAADEIPAPVEHYIQMTIDDDIDSSIVNIKTDDSEIAEKFKEMFGDRIDKVGFMDTF